MVRVAVIKKRENSFPELDFGLSRIFNYARPRTSLQGGVAAPAEKASMSLRKTIKWVEQAFMPAIR